MNLFVKALQDHRRRILTSSLTGVGIYVSQISESVATLNLYLNNSVGIGEHSDILAELKKYMDILDDAGSKLSTLNKYLNNQAPQKTVENE